MQTEEEIASTSLTMMDAWSLFLYGMKAPMTREKYRGRVAKFFDFIGFTEGTMEERAKTFTERGKKQQDWVFVSVLRFAQTEKEGVEKRDKPCYPQKLHRRSQPVLQNECYHTITWNKISSGLPEASRLADDRTPTLDDIRSMIK